MLKILVSTGYFTIPSFSYIMFCLADTAVREVREETGIKTGGSLSETMPS